MNSQLDIDIQNMLLGEPKLISQKVRNNVNITNDRNIQTLQNGTLLMNAVK